MPQKDTIIKLESLLNLSAGLNSAEDKDFIINSALLTLMGKLRIMRACAFEQQGDKYKIINRKGKIDLQEIDLFEVEQACSITDNDKAKILSNEDLKIILPMKVDEKRYLICLGSREYSDLAEDETRYASLVCNIASNALINADSLQKLKIQKTNIEKQNQLLSTMFEIRKDFSNLRSREQLIKTLSLNLMGQLMVSKFSAVSIDEKGNLYKLINRFNSKINSDDLNKLFSINETICIECDKIDEHIRDIFKSVDAKVISPAYVKGEKKGMLIVGSKMNGDPFIEDNINFINALGSTFFTELENERLFREEIEKKRLESELSLALEIQKNLLPKSSPKLDNFDVYGKSIPSRHVGGDYFDFIKLNDDKLLFIVADVSGKGVPASLIMANVQAGLRTLTPLNLKIDEITVTINKLIFENTASDKFVTAFIGILDDKNKKLTYINAGHNPPYLLRNKELNTLNRGGLLLGIMPDAPNYEIGEMDLEPDDIIYIFTDGVTEAKNLNNDEFGENQLENILIGYTGKKSQEIVDNIFNIVNDFSYGAGQYDDLTAIAIKCLK